jgi:DegV family protein with EDD domain
VIEQPVLVVTDSTSDMPESLSADLAMTVVPLRVAFGEETFRDGIDLAPTAFLDRLTSSPVLPKTSQPPVTDFEAVFQAAIGRGQDVVCITISSHLSGTFNAARLAAESVSPDRIRVIDSRSVTMQLGLIAVAAARVARNGGSLDDVAAEATAAIDRVKLVAVLQTLDYVYKGGRIGKASQLVGSALAIKPILSVVNGVLVPIERVRTWKKAVGRLPEMIPPTPTDIAVLHSRNEPDARALIERLRASYPETRFSFGYAGAVITTYAGPGAVGIAALYAG